VSCSVCLFWQGQEVELVQVKGSWRSSLQQTSSLAKFLVASCLEQASAWFDISQKNQVSSFLSSPTFLVSLPSIMPFVSLYYFVLLYQVLVKTRVASLRCVGNTFMKNGEGTSAKTCAARFPILTENVAINAVCTTVNVWLPSWPQRNLMLKYLLRYPRAGNLEAS